MHQSWNIHFAFDGRKKEREATMRELGLKEESDGFVYVLIDKKIMNNVLSCK